MSKNEFGHTRSTETVTDGEGLEHMVAVAPITESPDVPVTEGSVRAIIRAIPGLPESVREAPFTLVNERQLDDALFNRLIHQPGGNKDLWVWSARLEKRRHALRPHIGQLLVCVFIRLPGIHFTIEINPISGSVVHWEWENT